MTLLLVMIGAAVGAASRWLLDQAVSSRRDAVFPLGTLVINVLGSLVLGILLGAVSVGAGSAQLVALVGTGFCGGFTTFSTFGFETVRMAEDGSYAEAGLNVVASVAIGLVAAVAGWFVGQSVWS